MRPDEAGLVHLKKGLAVAATTAAVMLLSGYPASAIENGEPGDELTTQFVAKITVDNGNPVFGTEEDNRLFGSGHHETCSGSLVSSSVVVTAAHCVISLRPTDWTVTFGANTAHEETVDVASVSKYSPGAGATADPLTSTDDVAVVRLARKVTDRRPVRLDPGPNTVEQTAEHRTWVTELGYGLYDGDGSHDVTTIKRGGQTFVGVEPYYNEQVRARAAPAGLLLTVAPDSTPPGARVPSGRCRVGDSGGPLILDQPGDSPILLGALSLTGDTSGGWACAYTRLDAGDPYRVWLDQQITAAG